MQKKLFAVLKAESDNAAAAAKIDAIVKAQAEQLTAEERKPAGRAGRCRQGPAPNALYLLVPALFDLRSCAVLQKVKCPVLAINGEKDLQVDPQQNLPPIEAALKAGGNSDYTVKELPGLNHLFQSCQTGSPIEYGQIEETLTRRRWPS